MEKFRLIYLLERSGQSSFDSELQIAPLKDRKDPNKRAQDTTSACALKIDPNTENICEIESARDTEPFIWSVCVVSVSLHLAVMHSPPNVPNDGHFTWCVRLYIYTADKFSLLFACFCLSLGILNAKTRHVATIINKNTSCLMCLTIQNQANVNTCKISLYLSLAGEKCHQRRKLRFDWKYEKNKKFTQFKESWKLQCSRLLTRHNKRLNSNSYIGLDEFRLVFVNYCCCCRLNSALHVIVNLSRSLETFMFSGAIDINTRSLNVHEHGNQPENISHTNNQKSNI